MGVPTAAQDQELIKITEQPLLKEKYPAKAHAKKVAEYIKRENGKAEGVLYLESQKEKYNEDNDQAQHFRQRRYFYYLTGCELADSYVTYDIASDILTLFIPPIIPDKVTWEGLPLTTEQALQKYDIDACHTEHELNAHLAHFTTNVYAIPEQLSESTTFLSFGTKDFEALKTAIDVCRATKSPYEVAIMRHANAVSTAFHHELMRSALKATNERELESLILSISVRNGCKNQAYGSIVAGGEAAATLHYLGNDAPLSGKPSMLIDAGAEKSCYASDITRCFPLETTFSQEYKNIYSLVLKMQKECIQMIRAGVLWEDAHIHAHKILIAGLLEIGILKNGTVEEILEARTSAAFCPHGLGHMLGMDTHDTGGNPNYADKDPLFRYLRIRGKLPAGAVVTVEPGCYFSRYIIGPYLKEDSLHSKYIDAKVLENYWAIGGVRIEDNIFVTEDGFDNLTPTVKEVQDVEALVQSGTR